tara:strand:+ start:189 stop:497 length:309 start_codon:yes stop_codon:yes gene_type:complete
MPVSLPPAKKPSETVNIDIGDVDLTVVSPTFSIDSIDSTTTVGVIYYTFYDNISDWYVLKEEQNGTVFSYASVLNNPTITTPALLELTAKGSLTYGIKGDAF